MKRIGEGVRGLVSASGGLGYHLAALRYTPGLWKPFREDLSGELARRIPNPEETDLVLVGPSGGYCFEPEFLARFRSLVAIDIDPIAGIVFRRRVKKARFVRQDFFRALEKEGWDLSRWLEANGLPRSATVLFSNLLGQLGFLFGEARMREIDAGLSRALREGASSKTKWISFHDRFSVQVGAAPRTSLEFPARPSSAELAEAWTLSWGEKAVVGEILEHEVGEWAGAGVGPYRYLAWRLDAKRTQLIEICGNSEGVEASRRVVYR